jgi:hypothetical protein
MALHLFHQTREDDRKQRRVGEHPRGGLRNAVGLAVRPDAVADGAHEHVVVLEQPPEEGARRLGTARPFAARAQAAAQRGDGARHLREVLDREENALEHREDLVLHVPQALLRVEPLDTEAAQQLLVALGRRVPDPDDPLPLPAHGEDRMDRREDAQPCLAQVVLQALEHEGGVRGVALDDRRLERDRLGAARVQRLALLGVAHNHVDAGQAAVELGGRRELLDEEAEVVPQPRGELGHGDAERHPVGHLLVDDGGEGQQQLAVLGRRRASQDFEDLAQPLGARLRVGREHGSLPLLTAADDTPASAGCHRPARIRPPQQGARAA